MHEPDILNVAYISKILLIDVPAEPGPVDSRHDLIDFSADVVATEKMHLLLLICIHLDDNVFNDSLQIFA